MSESTEPVAQASPRKGSGLLTKLLLALAVIAAGLVLVIAMQPADFHLERKTIVAAPPAKAFAQVNDFRNWKNWSPWAKLDPAMKETYSEPSAGVGAHYSWIGNNEVGEGKMTIEESRPDELVKLKLEFIRPMAATHGAQFTFLPEGDQTTVTWSMDGENTFVSKAIHLMLDMDKLVGAQFEQGLADMKKAAEAAP